MDWDGEWEDVDYTNIMKYNTCSCTCTAPDLNNNVFKLNKLLKHLCYEHYLLELQGSFFLDIADGFFCCEFGVFWLLFLLETFNWIDHKQIL